MMELTISELGEINNERKLEWHEDIPWSPAEWGNAAAGEMGELCNVLKKILRVDKGSLGAADPDRIILVEAAGKEIADTFWYLNIIADELGLNMYDELVNKFNYVSRREGLPQRIPV